VLLEELYLSQNGIERIQNLEGLLSLKTLDVAQNKITKVENISHLTTLIEFWCNNNQVHDFGDLEQFKNITKIETVYFEANPIAKDANYRAKILQLLPSLKQIDATFVPENASE